MFSSPFARVYRSTAVVSVPKRTMNALVGPFCAISGWLESASVARAATGSSVSRIMDQEVAGVMRRPVEGGGPRCA